KGDAQQYGELYPFQPKAGHGAGPYEMGDPTGQKGDGHKYQQGTAHEQQAQYIKLAYVAQSTTEKKPGEKAQKEMGNRGMKTVNGRTGKNKRARGFPGPPCS